MTPFRIIESDDPDGLRRLALTGELDIASAPEFRERLRELAVAHGSLRLDLSQLDFIDSSGLSTLLLGIQESARDGWRLEVDPKMSRQVALLITVSGLDGQFGAPVGR